MREAKPMIHFDYWYDVRESAELLPNGLRVLRPEGAGSFTLMIWRPRAKKPSRHESFRTAVAREDAIARAVQAYDDAQARKARYKREAATGDLTLANSGAIFRYSWGYDQTQVEYFQVVARRGLLVDLERIASEDVESISAMSGKVRPIKDAFIRRCAHCRYLECAHYNEDPDDVGSHAYEPAAPITKRVQFSCGRPSLAFDHGVGSLVDVITFGNADPLVVGSDYCSSYA